MVFTIGVAPPVAVTSYPVITTPPLAGAIHETVTRPPVVPVMTTVGALGVCGAVAAMISTVGVDEVPVPTELIAEILNRYEVPGTSPDTVAEVLVEVPSLKTIHVVPSELYSTL
jgi:hypothetical protein